MRKRLLALLLALTMVVSILPVSVFAVELEKDFREHIVGWGDTLKRIVDGGGFQTLYQLCAARVKR